MLQRPRTLFFSFQLSAPNLFRSHPEQAETGAPSGAISIAARFVLQPSNRQPQPTPNIPIGSLVRKAPTRGAGGSFGRSGVLRAGRAVRDPLRAALSRHPSLGSLPCSRVLPHRVRIPLVRAGKYRLGCRVARDVPDGRRHGRRARRRVRACGSTRARQEGGGGGQREGTRQREGERRWW